jgi:hypothetical protein
MGWDTTGTLLPHTDGVRIDPVVGRPRLTLAVTTAGPDGPGGRTFIGGG